jgi:hypothetical protein
MTPFCLALIAATAYMAASNYTCYSASDAHERGLRHPVWIHLTLAAPLAALIYGTFSSGQLWQTLPVLAFGALIGSSIILALLHDFVFVARMLLSRIKPISATKLTVTACSPRFLPFAACKGLYEPAKPSRQPARSHLTR